MLPNELLFDGFERVKTAVHKTLEGLSPKDLRRAPTLGANSIGWLIWHLTRVQDDHIAELAHKGQIWENGWYDKFKLPFAINETGYGQSPADVAALKANADLLLGYYDTVHERTIGYIDNLKESDYLKVVDRKWDPPVTQAVRLISILNDDLQHVGQAAYIRGLLH